MAQLDIGKTALAGFGVIGRNPVAPIVWGLVTLVISSIPMLLILPTLMEFLGMALAGVSQNTEPDPAEMMRISAQINAVTPLTWIASLLCYALTTGALFRAMLRPQDRSWFFMRLGLAEVMLLVVTIVVVILFVLAALVAAAVIAAIAALAGLAVEGAWLPVAILLGLVALGVLVWGSLRFSLAYAMSWERKSFLLFESWKLTKGNALNLFLAWLLNFLILILLTVVVGLLVGGVMIAVLASTGLFEALSNGDPQAFFTPERLQSLWPVAVVWVLLVTILQSYATVIQMAPWAEAYRELVVSDEEAV